MNAAIYSRISDDRENTQAGVERQIEDCEAALSARGWSLFDHYTDNDISAWKGGRRPDYERLLADIEAGSVKAVVVYHQDRLHRRPKELEDFILLCDRLGVALASTSGDVDLSTGDGRFTARIQGAMAAKSSDDMSRRIRRKAQSLAQEGKLSGGGARPFGYEDDRLTIRESEAVVLRDAAARLLAGETLRGLTVDLNSRGVTTTTGREWHPNVLRRLLRSARISGQREHKGVIVTDAVWPGIITKAETASIRALFDDPSRHSARPAQKYLLTGVLRCGVCGALLSARPREDKQRRYVCAKGPGLAGRGCTYVFGPPCEEFVVEAMFDTLDSPGLSDRIKGHHRETAGDVSARVDMLTAELDELAEARGQQQITQREWFIAREPLQRQLEDARRALSRSASTTVISEHVGRATELRERWPDLSFDRKRAILRAVVVEVLVRPALRGRNRFDPHRFELVWRH